MARKASRLEVLLGLQPSGFTKGLNQAEKSLNRLGRRLQTAGRGLTAGITAPLVAAGGTAIKAAIDFETAMAGVAKTVSGIEIDVLGQQIRDMTKDLPVSAIELAGVAEAAGRMGIAGENIESFTRTVVNLAETSTLSSEEAATALARFANITQLPQQEVNRLATSISILGSEFAASETEIVALGLRLAGTGAQIGLTESQVVAFSTALAAVGIRAESGGTALSRVFTDIKVAVETGGEKLEAFAKVAGATSAEFVERFQRDAAGAIRDFIAGLGNLEGQGQSVFAVLNDLGQDSMRVRDALLRSSGAVDTLDRALRRSREAWEDETALQTLAAKRYQTTGGELRLLRNRLEDAQRSLGSALLPTFKEFLEVLETRLIPKIEEAVRWFAELDEDTRRNIISAAALTATVGPLVIGLGLLVSTAKSLVSVFALLARNPLVLVAAGVVALTQKVASYKIAAAEATTETRGFASTLERVEDAATRSAKALQDYLALAEKLNGIGREMDRVAELATAAADTLPFDAEAAAKLSAYRKQLAELQKQYDETLQKIKEGNEAQLRGQASQDKLTAAAYRYNAALDLVQKKSAHLKDESLRLNEQLGIEQRYFEEIAQLVPQDSALLAHSAEVIRGLQERIEALNATREESIDVSTRVLEYERLLGEEMQRLTGATGESLTAWQAWAQSMSDTMTVFSEFALQAVQDFTAGVGRGVAQALVYSEDFGKAMTNVFKQLAANIIASLIDILLQMAIAAIFQQATQRSVTTGIASARAGEAYAHTFASVMSLVPWPASLAVAPTQAAIAAAMLKAGSQVAMAFGEGAIVMGPVAGIVGEAGPEVVMPLDRLDDIAGIGGREQTINIYQDGRLLAKRVVKHMPGVINIHGAGA